MHLKHELMFLLCLVTLNTYSQQSSSAIAKQQIAEAEAQFANMAADKGIAEAFFYFADSNAVIKRENDTLIRGRDNIKKYYTSAFYNKAKVTWSPDFVDASSTGDMGYTFGKYNWKGIDASGKAIEFSGVFHTVWKKNAKGEWKYVWD